VDWTQWEPGPPALEQYLRSAYLNYNPTIQLAVKAFSTYRRRETEWPF